MKRRIIHPIYREYFVREHRRADYRHARAILRHRPDILLNEMSSAPDGNPDLPINRFSPEKKPLQWVRLEQRALARASKDFPYAKSDIKLWDNVMQLWREGHELFVFNIDGPKELRHEFFDVWNHCYPCATKNWVWWVHIFLRERYMANNTEWAIRRYWRSKKRPVVFIQFGGFHWRHVKFLLTHPTKKEIWKYYFGKFEREVTPDTISSKLRRISPVLWKHWRRVADL
ncbi:MAG: hypothetical protein RL681_298 [Candidatus Parcubacteria bacterium]|jgi:hypothetical protein